ncbi:FkbM family methyltransferase, partial [Streptomonospora algeriensis]
STPCTHRSAAAPTTDSTSSRSRLSAGLPVHGRAFLTTGARGAGPNAEFGGERPVHTRVTTLDALVEELGLQRVDFVKADVEGAEPAVLDGAVRTLRRYRPALLLEIEDRHLAKYGARAADLVTRLAEMGYGMRVWAGGAWRSADRVREGHRGCISHSAITGSPAAQAPDEKTDT